MRDPGRLRQLTASLLVAVYMAVSSMYSEHRTMEASGSIPSYLDKPGVSSTSPSSSKDPRPTGLNLVFIGDSITRHQYLSLAYFLRYGKWFKPGKTPHLVNQNDFMEGTELGSQEGWTQFFKESNKILSPMERCDCFRDKWEDVNLVDSCVIENRYFRDPERNNTLAYLQAFGNTISGMHGRLLPDEAFNDIASSKYKSIDSTYKWRYVDWGEAIEKYVAPLGATHIMMNAGYWPHDFDSNKTARDNLVRALKKTDIVGIWRTNTYKISKGAKYQSPEAVKADEVMTELFEKNVLNVSFTDRVGMFYYWDNKHFWEPVYRVMNENLLEMIGHHFPSKYSKQDLDPIMIWKSPQDNRKSWTKYRNKKKNKKKS